MFVDTNILLNQNFILSDYEKVATCITCIEELDGLKKSPDIGYKARDATKKLKNAINVDIKKDYDFSFENRFLSHNNDNFILGFAYQTYNKDNEFVFLTDDFNLWLKAKAINIPCELFEFEELDNESYKGYIDITLSDYDLASFYKYKQNDYGLLNNQYVIIRDSNGKISEKLRWIDNNGFVPITYAQQNKNTFKISGKSTYSNTIKPRNIQQELAFDLFQDRNITCKVIFGKHGSGKDLIMSYHALQMVESGVYDKIIFVRNNYEVLNSKPIGFLPGDERNKLLPYAMPLADHVGGIEGINKLIDDKVIELQHFGAVRGRDIKKSLIYVTEAENMTKEHIQLLISRLAEGSALWLNGDFKQVDNSLFERNSGLKQTINKLKGQELFGCVELNTTERSKTAQLADLLD